MIATDTTRITTDWCMIQTLDRGCCSPACPSYLLQLLTPSLLAHHLTVENHGGGAEAERHGLPHAALHKRLQVRVELREGDHLCQSDFILSLTSTRTPLNHPSGGSGGACIVPAPTPRVTPLMTGVMSALQRDATQALMRTVLLQRPHLCLHPC